MDAFSDLFRGVRAQGSLFGSSTLAAPWALRFVDGAPLTLCTVLEGSGWVLPPAGAPERLDAGDMLVVRGPEPFSFVDAVATSAEPVECSRRCAAPERGGTRHRLGWDDRDPAGATTLVVGAYPVEGEIGARLLEALPVVLRVDAGGAAGAVLDLLAVEVAVDAPGQQVVLDRLLDWMLVCALREWFERPDQAPAWYAAHRDPVVGRALRLLHAEPAAPWTVAALAVRTGVSRATLAKRFAELVGAPPMAYLTRWRMTLAADLLLEREGATIAEVARAVGYADAFSFSAAFKRTRGVSPSDRRRGAGPRARRAVPGLPDTESGSPRRTTSATGG